MATLKAHEMLRSVCTARCFECLTKAPAILKSHRALALVIVIAAALFATPALAKKRLGGKVVYTGINMGISTVYDSATSEGVGYNWGGSFKYIGGRGLGYGLSYNVANYSYDGLDGSELETALTTATVDIIVPLNFIHEAFDIYYSRAAIYCSALFGMAEETVKVGGTTLSLGSDGSGYVTGAALGMLYSYDLDPRRRQRKFGGLTLGGELRLLKFISMDTTSGEAQLNFTVGYSF